jgi:N4-gp56 family major capsid protein
MAEPYLDSGQELTAQMPSKLRTFYSQMLLDVVRRKSILVPFCRVKEDYRAVNAKNIIYTEAMDAAPSWDPVPESTIWMRGAHLDQRTVQIDLDIYGDVLKYNDFFAATQYLTSDYRSLVRGKLGQLVVDELDILARNAHIAHPTPIYMGNRTSRDTLIAGDIVTDTLFKDIKVDLEEKDLIDWEGDRLNTDIVCITTPRVCEDLRSGSDSPWMEVQAYAGGTKIFTGETGKWEGIRFVKSNRMRLPNYGAIEVQSPLAAATVAGQGAQQTDGVYTYGQANSIRTISVVDATGLAVGDEITIHRGDPGDAPTESDGSQEVRKIRGITGNDLTLDFPLGKPHAEGDQVTRGTTVHASVFLVGPSVVWGIAEAPWIFPLPKIDDLQLINRFGWRTFSKFQQFTPERSRVVFSSGRQGLDGLGYPIMGA